MRSTLHSFAATCTAAALLGLAGCTDVREVTAPDAPASAEISIPLLPVDPAVPPPPVTQDRVYLVEIENLTLGQPFSRAIFATHPKGVHLFQLGTSASRGIRLIAEEGNPSVAADELREIGGAFDIVTTDVPVHRIGGPGSSSLSLRIRAGGDFNRLSLATMLVCTNDGFTGGDGIELPYGFRPEMHYLMAYDAGTERNDELTRSLSDSCGTIGPVAFPANGNGRHPAEEKPIHPHRGIRGVGELIPSYHAWNGPVARLTITRLR